VWAPEFTTEAEFHGLHAVSEPFSKPRFSFARQVASEGALYLSVPMSGAQTEGTIEPH
jgi:hypothetical protein